MDHLLKILKALADLNRLRIVAALTQFEEMCACQITELLQITGASVSRHLALLTDAGILNSRKDGRWVFFRLAANEDDKQMLDWIRHQVNQADQVLTDRNQLKSIMSVDPEVICRKQRGETCQTKK